MVGAALLASLTEEPPAVPPMPPLPFPILLLWLARAADSSLVLKSGKCPRRALNSC